jgi:hypothetical protein
METTPELRKELRELLDEEIPSGGTEANTEFTDELIDRLLKSTTNMYAAAAEGWRRKAGKIQRKLGFVSSYQAGNERYEYVNLTTALNAALHMVTVYDDMSSRQTAGGYMFRVTPPEVL